MADTIGKSAIDIARAVRDGELTAREVVAEHLDHIASRDRTVGAFRRVRTTEALTEADAVDARPDRYSLPLAGVPVAVSDTVGVGGEYTGRGSSATSSEPVFADHELVRRFRKAGAVVVGITQVSELSVFPSEGGSAAAVGAGMVALAQGDDRLGSLTVSAADNSVVCLRPGNAVLPEVPGAEHWSGLAASGVLAGTVEDAERAFAVLSGRIQQLVAPGRLRIAVTARPPIGPGRDGAPVSKAARALLRHGHSAVLARPRYRLGTELAAFRHWLAAPAFETAGQKLDADYLQPRTRRHLRWGQRLRRPDDQSLRAWRSRVADFFADYDVLLTPAVPERRSDTTPQSWWRGTATTARLTSFSWAWSAAGVPVLTVPVSGSSSVQLVGPPDGEDLLLAVGRQLTRTA